MNELVTLDTKTPEQILNELIRQYRTEEISEELRQIRDEFAAIFEKMPIIAQRLLLAYKQTLAVYNFDPGEVRLYMVGGRVQGKQIKIDSDIDLIFTVTNKTESMGAVILKGYDPLESLDYVQIMMNTLINRLNAICAELGFTNHFHVLEFGGHHSQRKINTARALLIGTL